MKPKRIALLGLMLALALILGYVERIIPFNVGVAGVKIGLANIVVLLLLKRFGVGAALTVNILRIGIVNLLFGSVVSLAFSLFGGVLSTLAMYFAQKIKGISETGISAIGGATHNLGQTVAAALLLSTPSVLRLLPLLLLFGELSGIICGMVAHLILKRSDKLKI